MQSTEQLMRAAMLTDGRFQSITTWLFAAEGSLEIELRVGAQVHSAYQEEQMLGDQPVNGFIQGESYATYLTEPPLLGTDPANSPSLTGIITNGVEVNSTLLALHTLLSKKTGNKLSSPIPNFSIESQREERIEALASTIIPALIEGEKKWESESESEQESGNNWPIIGGLGAGAVVGLIAGLVWWVKKGRSKNLSSNDVEKGTTLPLNPSNTNNAGNDEYSLDSIPPNECVPLFGENEEEDGSEGSSSFPVSNNNSFTQANDYYKKNSHKKRP